MKISRIFLMSFVFIGAVASFENIVYATCQTRAQLTERPVPEKAISPAAEHFDFGSKKSCSPLDPRGC